MPYFKVMLEGEGIDIPSEDDSPSIIGFFTTRLVRASTTTEAENKAKDMILSEWSTGVYAHANRSSLPILSIESVHESGFLESLSFKNKGYSFYPDDKEDKTNNGA